MKKILFLVSVLPFIAACTKPNQKTATIHVWGNCNMCKKTIETSLKHDGIYQASWSPESKMLEVAFDSTRWDAAKIEKQVALCGYDTEHERGDNAAYTKLHECCQYDRKP